MLHGKINRQFSKEDEKARSLYAIGNMAPDTADFCSSCGHWVSRPIEVDGKKLCKVCNNRKKELGK